MARLTARPSQLRWLRLAALLPAALLVYAASGSGGDVSPASAAVAAAPTINSNDFPSIQAAIDSLRYTGGSVRIPAGAHLLPAKVRVYSNITVFGDGMDQTILKFAPGIQDHMMSNSSLSSGNANIVIRGLTLSGHKAPKSDCCYGLRLVNVRDTLVVNVASDGHLRDGFYLGYYRLNGVYNTRLSGCRARDNGRNGISLTHGSGNVIENCLVDRNNRNEQVAGIDLEPDEGLAVTDNKLVGNVSSNQNVGIQLYSYNRSEAIISNNAICSSTASGNRSAGIWDHNGTADIFVGNTTSGNGTNFSVDSSAKIGSAYAGSCVIASLPGVTPTPTPTPGGPTATPTPIPTATPTSTPTTRTVSTKQHVLSATTLNKGKATITSTVNVQNGAGTAVPNAQVTAELTRPDGVKTTKSGKTNSSGQVKLSFDVNLAGAYSARVTNIVLSGSAFLPGANDAAGPITVS